MGLKLFGKDVIKRKVRIYDIVQDRQMLANKVLADDENYILLVSDGRDIGVKVSWSGEKTLFEGIGIKVSRSEKNTLFEGTVNSIGFRGADRGDILKEIAQSILNGDMDEEIRSYREKEVEKLYRI